MQTNVFADRNSFNWGVDRVFKIFKTFFDDKEPEYDDTRNYGFANHLAKMYPESFKTVIPDLDFKKNFVKSEAESNDLRLMKIIAVVTFILVIFIVIVYAILLAALNWKKVKAYKNSGIPTNKVNVRHTSVCVSVQTSENSSFRGSISTNESGNSFVGRLNDGLNATDINAAWKPLLVRASSEKGKRGSFVSKLKKRNTFLTLMGSLQPSQVVTRRDEFCMIDE